MVFPLSLIEGIMETKSSTDRKLVTAYAPLDYTSAANRRALDYCRSCEYGPVATALYMQDEDAFASAVADGSFAEEQEVPPVEVRLIGSGSPRMVQVALEAKALAADHEYKHGCALTNDMKETIWHRSNCLRNALYRGNMEICELLFEHGAKVDQLDELDIAYVEKEHANNADKRQRLVALLVRHGAKVSTK
jgi:hypothetical protein